MKSYRGDGRELGRVLSCTTAADGSFVADNVHFREVKLCNVQESILTAFYTARGTYIDSLLQCLRGRLDEIQQNNAFKGIKILDTQMWPTDPDSLHCYGNDEFLLVLDHFRSLLVKRVSIDAVTSEWEEFKAFWLSNLRALSKDEVWSILLTRLESKYPNLLHLIELLLVFPVSNAKAERGFSTMRRIKSDWRNRLNEDTLDHLMRISIEGPPLPQFNPHISVQKFFSVPRRPDVQPYRKRGHEKLMTNNLMYMYHAIQVVLLFLIIL